ncbi:MAG: FxsA family protein [Candidatus Latescibacterota bacterium]
MLFRLFLLFTLIPVIELALLVEVGGRIGVAPTVAVVLGTGAAGAWLARSQGLRALQRLQEAVRTAQFPGEEIFDGILILAGGLLLLTPGFLTDILGFCALVPGSRYLLKTLVKSRVRGRMQNPRDGAVHAHYSVD